MKIKIRKHYNEEHETETNSVYIYDGAEKEYRIMLNNLGELEIQGSDGQLSIEPRVSNEIVIKQL